MRQLPVFDAFGHAFKSTFHNLGFAFYVSWPWMLAILPFNVFGNAYVFLNKADDPRNMTADVIMVSLGIALLTFVAFSSIAVNWHRYVLLDEVPVGMQRFRMDGTVWRYIGNIFLMLLMLIAAELVFLLGCGLIYLIMRSYSAILIVPATIAALLALIGYSYRLSCKLPGIALGREDIRFGEVLDATRGNFWPFVGLGFLNFIVIVGFAIVVGVLTWLITKAGGEALLYVVIAVQLFVNWVATIFGVTMLTSLYGYFIEKREF